MDHAEEAAPNKPLLYPPLRAIEFVSQLHGLAPVRLYPVLFPLWEVEFEGIQQRNRPYETLEMFLEKGIAQGELRSVAELATFLGLDAHPVEKTIQYLRQIDHVQGADGALALTRLGQDSLRDGVSYWHMTTQRKLYFEQYRAHPIPRDHYRLRFITQMEALTFHSYHRMFSFQSWRPGALDDLKERADRAEWNLPDEIKDIHVTAVVTAYLPLYVVRVSRPAQAQRAQAAYVVLSRITGKRDKFFEEIINTEPNFVASLADEAIPELDALFIEELDRRGLKAGCDRYRLRELGADAWRAIIPPETLTDGGGFPTIAALGTFLPVHGYYLQLWCDDPAIRREAALTQAVERISKWKNAANRNMVENLLATLASSLQTMSLEIADLLAWARLKEAKGVLDVLAELELT